MLRSEHGNTSTCYHFLIFSAKFSFFFLFLFHSDCFRHIRFFCVAVVVHSFAHIHNDSSIFIVLNFYGYRVCQHNNIQHHPYVASLYLSMTYVNCLCAHTHSKTTPQNPFALHSFINRFALQIDRYTKEKDRRHQ